MIQSPLKLFDRENQHIEQDLEDDLDIVLGLWQHYDQKVWEVVHKLVNETNSIDSLRLIEVDDT